MHWLGLLRNNLRILIVVLLLSQHLFIYFIITNILISLMNLQTRLVWSKRVGASAGVRGGGSAGVNGGGSAEIRGGESAVVRGGGSAWIRRWRVCWDQGWMVCWDQRWRICWG